MKIKYVVLQCLVAGTFSNLATAASYAPWLTQIGVTDAVINTANTQNGTAGVTANISKQILGVVDTGVTGTSLAFSTGQVLSTGSCAAVSFSCGTNKTGTDDNNHGTSVASIAAASKTSPGSYNTAVTGYAGYAVTKGSIIGVAPAAKILSEKVLNSQGTGTFLDVANGINKAAAANVNVINLSLTYTNASADVIKAVNAATAKGIFIVWAGGNSAQPLVSNANTTGLTATSLSHIIFAGSVSPTNVLSTFSNTPGTGSIVVNATTSGTYASRWIMAPGETILAPMVLQNGWGTWSGTSMSAPIVSGSLILLEAAWPILKTKGTAANLLLANATDLGVAGVDNTYGAGLVNLTKAFSPTGQVGFMSSSGTLITASTSGSSNLITSTAVGGMTSLKTALSNQTGFDEYGRNFTFNLSGLVRTPSSAVSLGTLPAMNPAKSVVMKLAGGGELSYMQNSMMSDAEKLGLFGIQQTNLLDQQKYFYTMFNDQVGNSLALGYGLPVAHAFGRTVYGDEELALLSSELNANSLSKVAQGGSFFTYGTALNENSRLSFSWNQSNLMESSLPIGMPEAQNLDVGYSHKLNDQVMLGMTLGILNENQGVLGSTYQKGGALGFGDSNETKNLGFSLGFNLNPNSRLVFETGFAKTQASQGSGLIAGTSAIISQSFGLAFSQKSFWQNNDRLTISVKQPLRVSSGSLELTTASVDEQGNPVLGKQNVSLVPDGREIDYKIGYATPLSHGQLISIEAMYRQDAFNIKSNDDAKLSASWQINF